jgi:hypothetical protein
MIKEIVIMIKNMLIKINQIKVRKVILHNFLNFKINVRTNKIKMNYVIHYLNI